MSNYQVPQRDKDPNKKTVHIIGKAVASAVAGLIARAWYEDALKGEEESKKKKKRS